MQFDDSRIPFAAILQKVQIGGGGFGIVYKAQYQAQPVAVKMLPASNYESQSLEKFRTEVKLMQRLIHERIVVCRGYIDEPEDQYYGIVMEFMDGGSLGDRIGMDNYRKFNQVECLSIVVDVAQGLAFLHSKGIVHHDLKPENIFLDRNNRAKVGDFGLSMFLQDSNPGFDKNCIGGTAQYFGPECFLEPRRYVLETDVYSYGCILWEMVAWQRIFSGFIPANVAYCISNGETMPIPENNYGLGDIINSCWEKDIDQRPTFTDILDRLNLIYSSSISNQGAFDAAGSVAHSLNSGQRSNSDLNNIFVLSDTKRESITFSHAPPSYAFSQHTGNAMSPFIGKAMITNPLSHANPGDYQNDRSQSYLNGYTPTANSHSHGSYGAVPTNPGDEIKVERKPTWKSKKRKRLILFGSILLCLLLGGLLTGILIAVFGSTSNSQGNSQEVIFDVSKATSSVLYSKGGFILTVDGELLSDIVITTENVVYFTSLLQGKIMKLVPGSSVPVEMNAASIKTPHGISIGQDFSLYICASEGNEISKLNQNGTVSTFSSSNDGWKYPEGIVTDREGNFVATDPNNHRIMKIDSSGKASVLVGSGMAGDVDGDFSEARINSPIGITIDTKTGDLYFADAGNFKIKKISITERKVTTVAGSGKSGLLDGHVSTATFTRANRITYHNSGAIFVVEHYDHRIRAIIGRQVVTVMGSSKGSTVGSSADATLSSPLGLAFTPSGDLVVVEVGNSRLLRIAFS
jgi:serine/threonine protein kinase